MEPTSLEVFHLDLQIVRSLAPRLDDWIVTPPSMPYWRLWWNSNPGASVIWEDGNVILGPDRVVIMAPHTFFEPILLNPIERHLYVHFLLGVPHGRVAKRIWSILPSPDVRAMLKRLVATLPADPRTGVAAPWLASALVTAVLAEFTVDDWPKPIYDNRIQSILDEIERNPGTRFTNHSLAALISMSVGGMVRLFVRHTGMTPVDYLERRRIELACLLLNRTSDSIDAIANQCGYCDRSYFTTAFTRFIGTSPAAYRHASQ